MNEGHGITDWAGRRALITGGAGFLGSNLAHALVARGARVTLLDCLLADYGGNQANLEGIGARLDWRRDDLRALDAAALDALLAGQDAVFHLAAQTSHMDSMADPLTDLAINATATLALLEAMRRAAPRARLVHASTRQVYGPPQRLPVDESHPLNPPDCNGVAKLAGEQYALLYARVHGLPATALRLTNCYGPRMRVKDARQTFVGVWVRLALEARPFEVWGGEQLRDFTYAGDVAAAMLAAAAAPAGRVAGRAFNLGGFPPVALAALAELVVAASGSKAGFVTREFPAERRKIDIGSYQADDRAFRAATGWAPAIDLAAGLAETFAYYRGRLAAYT